jgi:hypothetical protein
MLSLFGHDMLQRLNVLVLREHGGDVSTILTRL